MLSAGVLLYEADCADVQAQLYLPTWVPTKWMRLFTQPWEGDVTILLPWRLYSKSISKVIHNPEQNELVNADREGILAAWAHLSAIQVRPGQLFLLSPQSELTCHNSNTNHPETCTCAFSYTLLPVRSTAARRC